jgi:hypothetical protein
MGEPFTFPTPPTNAEIARNRAIHSALDAHIRSGKPVTREQVLYMIRTLPVCDSWGGPPCPPFPSDLKAVAEQAAPGSTVSPASVKRVYVMWNPGNVRY